MTTSTSIHHRRRSLTRALTLPVVAVALAVGLATAPAALATGPACGDTITHSLTLRDDLRDCAADGLIIGADHITLDLNGHTIDGDAVVGGDDTGVRLDGRTACDRARRHDPRVRPRRPPHRLEPQPHHPARRDPLWRHRYRPRHPARHRLRRQPDRLERRVATTAAQASPYSIPRTTWSPATAPTTTASPAWACSAAPGTR